MKGYFSDWFEDKLEYLLYAAIILGAIYFASTAFSNIQQAAQQVQLPTAVTPSQPSSPPKTLIRVGFMPRSRAAVFFVAREKGFFEGEGLDVQAVRYDLPSQNKMYTALNAGDLDFISPGNFVNVLENEYDAPGAMKIDGLVGESKEHPTSFLIKRTEDSDLLTPTDVENSTIGVMSRSEIVFAKKYFESKNINISSLTFIIMPAEELSTSLSSHESRLVFTSEPYATQLLATKNFSVFVSCPQCEFNNPFTDGPLLVVRPGFYQNNPNAVDAFRRAMNKALIESRRDPEYTKRLIAKYTDVPVEFTLKSNLYSFYTSQETYALIPNAQKTIDVLEEDTGNHTNFMNLLLPRPS
ncbi:MAG TPA: ABC transporter substrate-binding protein [Candidatus Norongarragalinales archaeon]|jgi:NitT/TauT family transport system substrate-binding protein|nr:ABC transporter substrate-binding protein [Candidatus Norongarragalinales archaeon]